MGINSLILIMPWEGSAQIIILHVPREGASHSLRVCIPTAPGPWMLWKGRQDQPHSSLLALGKDG